MEKNADPMAMAAMITIIAHTGRDFPFAEHIVMTANSSEIITRSTAIMLRIDSMAPGVAWAPLFDLELSLPIETRKPLLFDGMFQYCGKNSITTKRATTIQPIMSGAKRDFFPAKELGVPSAAK